MVNTKISDLSLGHLVKIKLNNKFKNFKIISKSKPNSSYDDSCSGIWLLMEDCISLMEYGSSQLYNTSSVTEYLNNDLYENFENGAKGVIKTVKIPYSSSKSYVSSGSDGMECKVFLLSATELNLKINNINTEGEPISYFSSSNLRIANYDGDPHNYITRSLENTTNNIIYIDENGEGKSGLPSDTYGIRPVIVIYPSCYVDEDNILIPDIAPIITSITATNGSDLGNKSNSFTFNYTVTTSRSDLQLKIEEEISGTNITKIKKNIDNPQSGSQRSFSIIINNSDDFFKLMNGTKKITIRASYSDYSDSSVNSKSEYYVTFNKYTDKVTITLKSPMHVSGNISKGFLKIGGIIPDDSIYQIKVTNNGNSSYPTWKDVTTNVKNGSEFSFTSYGNYFNFQIYAERGSSDESGYISGIVGAFE